MTPRPADGTAVILHLIEAARAYGRTSALSAPSEGVQVMNWAAMLETYLAEAAPGGEQVGWEARAWGEVLEGDRVSLGGVEALVKQSIVNRWHVDPDRKVWHTGEDDCKGCTGVCRRGRGYQSFGLEHSQARVTLEWDGQVKTYGMPTDGEIEVLRGPAGQAADKGRKVADPERAAILEGWAADAYQILAAAGLSPEVMP